MTEQIKQTPMMQQYAEMRGRLSSDTLLLFHLGDFYEMFGGDAEVGARILGITLTQRNGTPMAGMPCHSVDGYIGKLLNAGKKVAICEQVGEVKAGALVRREVTRILTPGTVLEDTQIEAGKNRYLLSINVIAGKFVAAWGDVSTGVFGVASEEVPEDLLALMYGLDAAEVVVPEGVLKRWREDPSLQKWVEGVTQLTARKTLSEWPDFRFDRESGAKKVKELLGVLTLRGFGIADDHAALGVAGALIQYMTEHLCQVPKNIQVMTAYQMRQMLLMDGVTLRNLEVFRATDGGRQGTLIAAIDRTVTASGARLLESYLSMPSLDLQELKRRQSCVREFLEEPIATAAVREQLRKVRDIVRVLSRLEHRVKNPRELGSVYETLFCLPHIQNNLGKFKDCVCAIGGRIGNFDDLRELLSTALLKELPNDIALGGVFAEGYDAELDRLRGLNRGHRSWLEAFERKEQERSGIRNLKVRYNDAFGYFIEVTKSSIASVPSDYIRKQTMTNAERYYTHELREREVEILHAEEKAVAREGTLFKELVGKVLSHAESLRKTADALAELDLFSGWSQLAREWDYCCPELDESEGIVIEQGRHPVIEQMLKNPVSGGGSEYFVPNNTCMEANNDQILLITGPNMAGKSTYIRQVGVIVLMAQIGCWVPAKSCHIGLVDRLFSRIGASDELSRGHSTFMVEMYETANILHQATARSLVILDEIGRGTSTYDGLSIAWSVVEYLHRDRERGPRTLFATHYHELTRLEKFLPRLRNYSVAVKEWNDTIIFIRQIISGAADRSYGIQVARLAGLPAEVIARAKVVLEKLEEEGIRLRRELEGPPLSEDEKPLMENVVVPTTANHGQMSLFDETNP